MGRLQEWTEKVEIQYIKLAISTACHPFSNFTTLLSNHNWHSSGLTMMSLWIFRVTIMVALQLSLAALTNSFPIAPPVPVRAPTNFQLRKAAESSF